MEPRHSRASHGVSTAPPRGGRFGAVLTTLAVSALWAGAPTRAPSQCDPIQILGNPVEVPPGVNSTYGFSIAMSGDRILVGAPEFSFSSTGEDDAGVVYLMHGTTGSVIQTFRGAPNPGYFNYDYFGVSLAFSDANVLVGALNTIWVPLGATGVSGNVYLFEAATGSVLRTFDSPDSPPGYDYFGASIAVSGDRLLVGAPRYPPIINGAGMGDADPLAGRAFLFEISTGALVRTFASPRSAASDGFGSVVAMTGDFIAVGAGFTADEIQNPTAFLFDASTGTLLHTFDFGSSVAISGNRVLIGSSIAVSGPNSVIANLYDAQTGEKLQTFTNPAPVGSGILGGSIALSENRALVGNSGGSYLYDIGTASPIAIFPPPPGGLLFGRAIAMEGQRVAVGAPEGGHGPGKVFIYDCTPHPIMDYLLGRRSDPAGLDLNLDGAVDISDLYLR